MTIVKLLQSIKEVVDEALTNASFNVDGDTEEGSREDKRVNVVLGYLPQKTAPEGIPVGAAPLSTEEDETPFVIIRATAGEDESYQVDVAKVKILVGTKSYKNEGYMDVLHIFELIRFAIARKNLVSGMFELTGKLKWMLPEEQPWPEWNGVIETTWTLPGVEKEAQYEY